MKIRKMLFFSKAISVSYSFSVLQPRILKLIKDMIDDSTPLIMLLMWCFFVELRQLSVARDPELNVGDVLDAPEPGHLHLLKHVVGVTVVPGSDLASESFEQPEQ